MNIHAYACLSIYVYMQFFKEIKPFGLTMLHRLTKTPLSGTRNLISSDYSS